MIKRMSRDRCQWCLQSFSDVDEHELKCSPMVLNKNAHPSKVLAAMTDIVYIGRPSKWGNPFKIGIDGTRMAVVTKYADWIKTQPKLMSSLPEIAGKSLMCWCAPLACHGDVLVLLANQVRSEK